LANNCEPRVGLCLRHLIATNSNGSSNAEGTAAPTAGSIHLCVELPSTSSNEMVMGPCGPKAESNRTCSINVDGHSTVRHSNAGALLRQPQAWKSSHPALIRRCARVFAGITLQLQLRGSLPPQNEDCSLDKVVPVFPQIFAIFTPRSKPGTATLRWKPPSPHPGSHGWHRFFFMTTAVQFLSASRFLISMHLPHPPAPPVSEPQSFASGPRNFDTASDTAPVIHSFSPYLLPPWAAGSMGAYSGGDTYLLASQGCKCVASQLCPLQSQ